VRDLRRPVFALALLTLGLVGAQPVAAQGGLAGRLGDPRSGSPSATPSAPAAPTESPDELTVPEPPGSVRAQQAEPRYPIPTPEQAARALEDEPSIRIPSRVTTRLRSLDAHLTALGARGGANVVNAVLSLLTGGLSITLGALRSPNDDAMSIYLYVYGGTAAIRGVLDFALTPNAQGAAITYQHMPMSTTAEVRERLEYGERALGGVAEQSLIARVLDGSLNMAAGVAVVPIFFAERDFGDLQPLDYFVLIGAGVSVVSGIITLASTSSAEQRWSSYQELRERLRRERREELEASGERARVDEDELAAAPPPSGDLRLSVAPSPTGFLGGLSLTF
jgi:hypothetical protein